jgi:hypothetical protein
MGAMARLYKSNPDSKVAQDFISAYYNFDMEKAAAIYRNFMNHLYGHSDEEIDAILRYHAVKLMEEQSN